MLFPLRRGGCVLWVALCAAAGGCWESSPSLHSDMAATSPAVPKPRAGDAAADSAQQCAALIEEGRALLAQGKLDEAAQRFVAVCQAAPHDVRARVTLATIRKTQGRAAEAIDHFRQALALDPQLPPVANDLAWLLVTAADAGLRQPDEAVRWAEAACRATGYRQPAYLDTLAAAYQAAGQERRAAAIRQQVAALQSPRAVDAAAVVSAYLSNQPADLSPRAARSDLSFVAWVLAVHQDPRWRDPPLARELAGLLLRSDNQDDARLRLILAAALAAEEAFDAALHEAHQARRLSDGRLDEEFARQLNEALDLFNRGVPLRCAIPAELPGPPPDSPAQRVAHAFFLLGNFLDSRQASHSPAAYATALYFHPQGPFKAALARSLLDAAEIGLAAHLFAAVVGENPQDFEAHVQLARLHQAAGNTASAIDHFQRAMALRPQAWEVVNALAWLHATCNDPQFRDPQRAVALAGEACRATHFQNPEYCDTLAAAHAAAGQYEPAQQAIARAIALQQSRLTHAADQAAVDTLRRYQLCQRLYEAHRPFVSVRQAHVELGKLFLAEGHLPLAAGHLDAALDLKQDFEALAARATLAKSQGDLRQAIDLYALALAHRPGEEEIVNTLAWLLATAEDPRLRRPDRAVELATQLCQRTGFQVAEFLDTLAVAHAARLDFATAADYARQALGAAQRQQKTALGREIQTRLETFVQQAAASR